MTDQSIRFEAGKGSVSGRLQIPEGANALLVLGHGAGANFEHHHMESIADALANRAIGTLRFNFPYMEAGGGRTAPGRTDPKPVCLDTIAGAITEATTRVDLPTYLGGHSFGGRMASHFAAERGADAVRGMIYFSFPLHPAKKPATTRATHLPAVKLPQLFLSGTRDVLAELELLRPVVAELPHATLHELHTADHSFKILKRTRTSTESVYDEAARIARGFIDATTCA